MRLQHHQGGYVAGTAEKINSIGSKTKVYLSTPFGGQWYEAVGDGTWVETEAPL